jgi:hypothetical protein
MLAGMMNSSRRCVHVMLAIVAGLPGLAHSLPAASVLAVIAFLALDFRAATRKEKGKSVPRGGRMGSGGRGHDQSQKDKASRVGLNIQSPAFAFPPVSVGSYVPANSHRKEDEKEKAPAGQAGAGGAKGSLGPHLTRPSLTDLSSYWKERYGIESAGLQKNDIIEMEPSPPGGDDDEQPEPEPEPEEVAADNRWDLI